MRTTIVIDDALMLILRERERSEKRSLKDLVNEALARGLGDIGPVGGARGDDRWTCGSRDLGRPRLDLEKALRLADLMEADAVAEKWELGK